MRRSENRGEPRETFASNSRDSQDFEIFSFLSFPLLSLSFSPTAAFVPQQRASPPATSAFLRPFRDRLSLFLDSSPRSLSRHRWESSTIEMAKRLPFFLPCARFTDLSCSRAGHTAQRNFTLVERKEFKEKFKDRNLNLCYRFINRKRNEMKDSILHHTLLLRIF